MSARTGGPDQPTAEATTPGAAVTPGGVPPDAVDEILAQWRRVRPDLDPTPMGVFGRIARILTQSRAQLSALLDRHGLTLASFDVLANLRRSGPPYRKAPSELAATSMLSPAGVTFRLDKLAEAGLIRRVPSEHDRRVVFAELTPDGLALIDEVIGAHLDQEHRMLAALDPAEVVALADLLRRLEHSVRASGRPGV